MKEKSERVGWVTFFSMIVYLVQFIEEDSQNAQKINIEQQENIYMCVFLSYVHD